MVMEMTFAEKLRLLREEKELNQTELGRAVNMTQRKISYLENGKYETSLPERDDFAAVCGDLIIMRLRNPEKESGTEDGYWDWGGRYEVMSDNRIWLDMDRQTRRQWSFYYELSKTEKGGIRCMICGRKTVSFWILFLPVRGGTPSRQPAAETKVPSRQPHTRHTNKLSRKGKVLSALLAQLDRAAPS